MILGMLGTRDEEKVRALTLLQNISRRQSQTAVCVSLRKLNQFPYKESYNHIKFTILYHEWLLFKQRFFAITLPFLALK